MRRVLGGDGDVSCFLSVVRDTVHRAQTLCLVLHRLYLCAVARHPHLGDSATYFQIWHEQWDCGADRPTTGRIHMRKPGKKCSSQQIFGGEDVHEEEEKNE